MCSPNVRLYRDDEFLRRARAQSLGVRATMAVPLFDPSAIGAASMDARLLSAPGIGPSPDVTGHASAPDAQAYPFDPPLTPNGVQQAKACGYVHSNSKLKRIF